MDFFQHFDEQQLKVLEERATRVKQATQSDESADIYVVLTVTVNQEQYALPVDSLLGTYLDVKITKLPGAPEHIAGIVNLRGHMTTVLDLGAALGLASIPKDRQNALVVATNGTNQVALLVDKVSEVQTILSSEVHSASSAQQTQHTDYQIGVLINGTAVLDVQAIIDAPKLVVDQAIS